LLKITWKTRKKQFFQLLLTLLFSSQISFVFSSNFIYSSNSFFTVEVMHLIRPWSVYLIRSKAINLIQNFTPQSLNFNVPNSPETQVSNSEWKQGLWNPENWPFFRVSHSEFNFTQIQRKFRVCNSEKNTNIDKLLWVNHFLLILESGYPPHGRSFLY